MSDSIFAYTFTLGRITVRSVIRRIYKHFDAKVFARAVINMSNNLLRHGTNIIFVLLHVVSIEEHSFAPWDKKT